MAKTKKGAVNKRRPSRSAEVMNRIESFLGMIAPDIVRKLTSAEMRAVKAESELNHLRSKLTALLSPDQLEAARICSMAPEYYAIEHIDIWKERMFNDIPVGIVPLKHLGRQR